MIFSHKSFKESLVDISALLGDAFVKISKMLVLLCCKSESLNVQSFGAGTIFITGFITVL